MKSYYLILLFAILLAGCTPLALAVEAPVGAGVASPTPAALLGRYTTAQPSPLPVDTIEPQATATISRQATATLQDESRIFSTETGPADSATHTVTPTPSPLEGFRICTPLADILLGDLPRLTSDGYHPPLSTRSDARHPGVDIAFYNWKGHHQIAGFPIQSVLPGRVALAEVNTFPFGNVVVVETQSQQIPAAVKEKLGIAEDRSLYLLYAHMQDDSLRVALGDVVTPCQTLGQVGKSGNSGQAHLHFENRIGPPGVQFVGFAAYTDEATQAEKDNYRRWATSGEFKHFDPLRLLLYEFGYDPTPTLRGDRGY
jgi:murein DD-endopeptidase MepM/ murein hydrolase activator NlpD